MRRYGTSAGKWVVGMLAIGMLGAGSARAFLPYESHLREARVKRVLLMAEVKEGKLDILTKKLNALREGSEARGLRRADIQNMSAYARPLAGKTYCFVYFEYTGKNYLGAAEAFEKARSAEPTEAVRVSSWAT